MMEQIIDDPQRNPSRRQASTSVAARNVNSSLTAHVHISHLNGRSCFRRNSANQIVNGCGSSLVYPMKNSFATSTISWIWR